MSEPANQFHMVVDVTAETSQEAWSKLNAVLCEACDHKQDSDHQWPQYISTNDGTIKCVSGFQKQSAEKERDELRVKVAEMQKRIGMQQDLIRRLEDELIN